MKTGRNDPCPCGSGKKYKQCCLAKEVAPSMAMKYRRLSEVRDRLMDRLLQHAERVFGPEAVAAAMSEFLVWPTPEDEVEEAVVDRAEPLFWPWYVFNWVYDGSDALIRLPGPEMKTVAELYAETRGKRLDPIEKFLINTINREPYSFWEVLATKPGDIFKLEDLLGGACLDVFDSSGLRSARVGDLLFGRVVDVSGVGMAVGLGWTVIPSPLKTRVIALKEWLRSGERPITKETLTDWDAEIREWFFNIENTLYDDPESADADDPSQPSAPIFAKEVPPSADSPDWMPDWIEDPEVMEQLAEAISSYWERWLDQENDALDGLSPRQAAKTKQGRRAVAALLDDMEKEEGLHSKMTDVNRLGVKWARDLLGVA